MRLPMTRAALVFTPPMSQPDTPLMRAVPWRRRRARDPRARSDGRAGGARAWRAPRDLRAGAVGAGAGGRLSVDAGVRAPDRARETLADGAARVVVGLETLPSLAVLEAVARAVGSERLVFSLDLRRGRPVAAAGARHLGTPLDAAGAAVAAGAGAILVLDLARIGSGRGVNRNLVAAIREAHPAVELLAGGGVASARDLERLADVGCDGALVATALHAGTVRREDIEAVRRRTSRRERHASDSR